MNPAHEPGPVCPDAGKEPPLNLSATAQAADTLDDFLRQVGPRAFRFAELGLRHREDALDAVQDAMLKMLAYRQRPTAEWPPLFWRILRTRIIDAQRRRRFRLSWMGSATLEDGSEMEWADPAPGPSRRHDSREAWQRMRVAMRALPARQREAFSLRVLEAFDVADTAAIMGCSEGSVKTHLSRARAALQKHLEDWR